jgi:GntR family transcriptional regulator
MYSRGVADASITIEQGSPVPVYRQVIDQIRFHLNAGALAPGDALPSVRSLATQLGVHFNTIAEAYRQLAQEGWIDLSHGRRAVVLSSQPSRSVPDEELSILRQRLRHLVAEMRLKGISTSVIQRDIRAILER